MLEVIPGILEHDWREVERKIELAKGFAKTIHIDIEDGKLTSNKTFLDPEPFKKYTPFVFFELHMMVEEPALYLKSWAEAGFRRFLGHIEKMSDQEEFVAQGQLLGEVGLALDGPTTLDSIQVPLDDLDTLLIYTAEHVGFSGLQLLPERLEKITALRAKTALPIEVDGGINESSIVRSKQAGATRFISTSYIFASPDPRITYEELGKLIS